LFELDHGGDAVRILDDQRPGPDLHSRQQVISGAIMRAAPLLIVATVLAGAADNSSSLEGTIFNAASGEPLRKALITLRPAGGPARSHSATSDNAGHYVISGIEAGLYRLIVERPGFSRQELGAKRPGQPGTPIGIAPGEKRKDVDLRLSPQGVVTGRVLDEDGDPVPMALVSLMRRGYVHGRKQLTPSGQTASTNDLGEYRLFGLAPGRYYLTASYRPVSFEQAASAEDAYPLMYYPGATSPEGAASVEVTAGSTLRGVDIRFQKMHAVHIGGRALDGTTNDPAGGAIVMLTPRAEGALNTAGQKISRTFRNQGLFEFNGVTPGSYILTAHLNNNQQLSARTPVEVGQSDIDNLTLTLTPGGEIPGVVKMEGGTGDVPKGLVIQLEPTSEADSPSTPLKNDGSFRLQHVQAETYAVRVYGLPETTYVKGVRFGEADAPDSGLDFSRGFTPGELVIALAPTAAHVDGTVLDDQGQPFAGARVVIALEKGRSLVVPTDLSGRFTAGGLAPGNYRAWAFDEIENGACDDPEYMKPYESNAERLTLNDNDRQTVQLKLIVSRE
jgi:protocatechuate 3,4-dioxygenase beta subunit